MRFIATVTLAMALAACGGGGGPSNTSNAPSNSGSGYGDHHTERNELGIRELPGGYSVQLYHVPGGDTEGIFEVYVRKDGETVRDVSVDVWFGDSEGEILTPVAGGEWMDDLKAFDVHVLTPPSGLPEDAHVWVRLRRDDYKEKAGIPFKQ